MPTYYGVKFPEIPSAARPAASKAPASAAASVSAAPSVSAAASAAGAQRGSLRMPDRVVPVSGAASLRVMPDRVVPVSPPAPASAVPVSPPPPASAAPLRVMPDTRLAQMARAGAAVYQAQRAVGATLTPVAAAPTPAPTVTPSAGVYLPLPIAGAAPPHSNAPAVSAPLGIGASPDVILGQEARRYEAAGLRPPPDVAPPDVRALEFIGREAVRPTVDIFGMPLSAPSVPAPISGAGADVRLEQSLRLPARAAGGAAPAPSPWVEPETWAENQRLAAALGRAATAVGAAAAPVVQPALGVLTGVAQGLDWLYQHTTEPLYVGITRDPQRELLAERARLMQDLAAGRVSADRVPAYRARVDELTRQIQAEMQRRMDPLYAARQAYATPEQVAEFRRTAPWYEQLIAGAALDLTNVFSLGIGRLAAARRLLNMERSLQPVAASVADVERVLRTEGTVGAGLGRLLPWRLTNEAQRAALIDQTIDMTRLVMDPDHVPGNALDNLRAFIVDPEALAPATGGLTASLPAKRAAVVLRRAFTDPQTGALDLGTLEKLVRTAPDRWEAVTRVAQRFEDAALTLFPQQPRSLPYRLRDAVYNYMAIGHMGYNPAYAVRNAVNNLAVALVDGYVPLTNPQQMRKVLQRWGPMPVGAVAGIGPAGIWQKQAGSASLVERLQTPLDFGDLFEGVGWKAPTITLSGNVERAFGERIWFVATMDTWRQLWNAEIHGLRRRLAAAGVPAEAARLVGDELAGALNPREVRQGLARLEPHLAPGAAVSVATAAGAPPPLRLPPAVVLPAEELETLSRVIGREGAEQVRGLVAAIKSADHVAPVLASLENVVAMISATTQRQAEIETLGRMRTAATQEGILGFLRREGEILEQIRAENDDILSQIWRQTHGLHPDEQDAIWKVYWDTFTETMRRTHRLLDDLEEAQLPALGFTEAAVRRARRQRSLVRQAWGTYARRLRDTWQQSRTLRDWEARDNLWREFKAWSAGHWEALRARSEVYYTRRGVDITEAVARATAAPAAAPAAAAPAAAAPLTAAAPAEAVALPPTLAELFDLARQVGIPTATRTGRPLNAALLNFARKHIALPRDVKLNAMTDAQRSALREALQQRLAAPGGGAARIPPGADLPPPSLRLPPPAGAAPLGIVWHPMSPAAVWQTIVGPLRQTIGRLGQQAARTVTPLSASHWQLVNDEVEALAKQMVRTKAVAERIGVQARHFALGDYARRRNLHDLAMFIFPYFTWYGFSIPNWAIRLARSPAILAHYARYRRLLEEENDRYWKERYGIDEVPPQYRGRLRVPWVNGPLHIQLENIINPMYALVDEDFTTRELARAPDYVNLIRRLGSYGPSLSPPILWGLALSIAESNPAAARQLVGYQVSVSRPFKSFTAMLREWFPALRSVIPPGGLVPEAIVNPTVRGEQPLSGGDIWSEARLGMYLSALVEAGEITREEAEWAARQRSGPAWEAARQAEAVAAFYPDLFSFLIGMGLRPSTDARIRKAIMDAEWFDLRERAATMPEDARREAFDAFHRRWNTYALVQLAREFDPVRRLSLWTWMVLDRLPPGYQRYRLFAEVGITDLIDKFYAARGRLEAPPAVVLEEVPGAEFQYPLGPRPQWTEEELLRLAEGIDALAQRFGIPSPAREEEWQRARAIHEAKRKEALLAIQGIRGLLYDEDDIRAIEAAYPRAGTDAEKEAYLSAHPELRAFWEALDAVERTLEPEALALERSVYESPEAARNRRIWEESLPPGGRWRRGLTVPAYVDDLYDESRREAMSDEEVQRALDWLQANVPAAFRQPEEWRQARRENAEFQQVAQAELGEDIVELAQQYGALSRSERRRWRAQNPQAYARLQDFWDLKREYGEEHPVWQKYYGLDGAGGEWRGGARARRRRRYAYRRRRGGWGGGGWGGGFPVATPVPGGGAPVAETPPLTLEQYTALLATRRADPSFDPLARLLFGNDIFDLLTQFFALTPEEQAPWIAQNEALYRRILRFLTWLAGGGGQNATRALESIPQGVGGVRQESLPLPAPPSLRLPAADVLEQLSS